MDDVVEQMDVDGIAVSFRQVDDPRRGAVAVTASCEIDGKPVASSFLHDGSDEQRSLVPDRIRQSVRNYRKTNG